MLAASLASRAAEHVAAGGDRQRERGNHRVACAGDVRAPRADAGK